MKIHFHGAARTVTGSQYLLEINGSRLLLECGLFQGKRADTYDKNRNFKFDPSEIDAVILSHAGQRTLVDYAMHVKNNARQIFLAHGEPDASEPLQGKLHEIGISNLVYPDIHQSVEL